MRKRIRKISPGSVLLVLALVLTTSATAGATPNHAVQPKQQTSPYGSSWINVTTMEKYGTKNHPQYQPLGNVSLTLWGGSPFFGLPYPMLSFLKWRHDGEIPPQWFDGISTDQGKFVIPHVYEGNSCLFGYKEGYIDLHYKWGVSISMDGTCGFATVTLTAKGSAWDPSVKK